MKMSHLYSAEFENFLKEDELGKNPQYIAALPKHLIECRLKIKDDLMLAGLPFFAGVFEYLGASSESFKELLQQEGKSFLRNEKRVLEFQLPVHIALSGERLALNLLQRCSAIATQTQKFVAKSSQIKILDTRKTTPGLRFLEKYAVALAGGVNHRFSQTDIFMIKDNHKKIFGGVNQAVAFFKTLQGFYQPIVLEVHDLVEIEQGDALGIKHFMLDNFSCDSIREAISMKKEGMTFEVSGGINLSNLEDYLIDGVDCISSGSLTYDIPHVDLSLKMAE